MTYIKQDILLFLRELCNNVLTEQFLRDDLEMDTQQIIHLLEAANKLLSEVEGIYAQEHVFEHSLISIPNKIFTTFTNKNYSRFCKRFGFILRDCLPKNAHKVSLDIQDIIENAKRKLNEEKGNNDEVVKNIPNVISELLKYFELTVLKEDVAVDLYDADRQAIEDIRIALKESEALAFALVHEIADLSKYVNRVVEPISRVSSSKQGFLSRLILKLKNALLNLVFSKTKENQVHMADNFRDEIAADILVTREERFEVLKRPLLTQDVELIGNKLFNELVLTKELYVPEVEAKLIAGAMEDVLEELSRTLEGSGNQRDIYLKHMKPLLSVLHDDSKALISASIYELYIRKEEEESKPHLLSTINHTDIATRIRIAVYDYDSDIRRSRIPGVVRHRIKDTAVRLLMYTTKHPKVFEQYGINPKRGSYLATIMARDIEEAFRIEIPYGMEHIMTSCLYMYAAMKKYENGMLDEEKKLFLPIAENLLEIQGSYLEMFDTLFSGVE